MNSAIEYVWQRRIHHGVRFQKSAVPFPESVAIGLEFNAALDKKERLDLSLLTNAVMLELCDFAKCVSKSESYFLFEILEFNFDLGVNVDNEMQCHDFSSRVQNKLKGMRNRKLKPHMRKETFPLPDVNDKSGSTGSAPGGNYCPKVNRTVDISLLTEGSTSSQAAVNPKTAASSPLVVKKRGGITLKLTDNSFPYCQELGVTFFVRPENPPKEKLSPNLLTKGVMMEILDFSTVLCGTYTGIVYDLVKQNFGYEMDILQFRWQVSKIIDRKHACLKAEDMDAFRKEPFIFQRKKQEELCNKRRKPDTDHRELHVACKRRSMLTDSASDAVEILQDADLSYMCPVDFETEMQSGTEAEPEKTMTESGLSEAAAETMSRTAEDTMPAVLLDVKQEEEEVFVSSVQPQIIDPSSSLFNVQPKNAALTAVSDLFSDDKSDDMNEKTPKQKLWLRRAARSKQILTSSRVNDRFSSCREIGLDFNVGSGNKQSVDLQLFTNCVLLEVYKFATAMKKSLQSFLCEILENNFNVLQDGQRSLIFNIITKEKTLRTHPARHNAEFLSKPFKLPEAYNMVDVTKDLKCEAEQQTHLDSAASGTTPQEDLDPYQFCRKIGLNLWSTEQLAPHLKLDLTALTTGAVREMFNHVRDLCGTVRHTVNDILEHNFDLDLQSGETNDAKVIHKWYNTQRSLMTKHFSSAKINRWIKELVPLNVHSKIGQQPTTGNGLEVTEDLQPGREMSAFNGNVPKVKIINSYRACEEIGLDLDTGTKLKPKTKLDLRVLTRGVLLELHLYVLRNSQRYVPSLYQILEYNFDLSSQSHRKVEFAWSIASQVLAIAGKISRKGSYLEKTIELPFEFLGSSQIVCKEEPADGFGELDRNDKSDVVFVREMKPVDIEVEIH